MNDIFETIKPIDSLIAEYVDYYYLDVKAENIETKFECFPHYNNTISIYKSNICLITNELVFNNNTRPLQIFTPIRKTVLQVKQLGKVHRIVIVFKPLGIQQFYKNLKFTDYITNYEFFNSTELVAIFNDNNITSIATKVDEFLFDKFIKYSNETLEKSISLILNNFGSLAVAKIATELEVSRRHLNRLFKSHFGISVKKFNEIVLFRKTIEKKLYKNPEQSFTELAYEFNYCDQSHLNKAFRNLTLNSPSNFLKKGTLLGNEDIFWHLNE